MTKGMILTQFLFIEPCSSMVLLMMLVLRFDSVYRRDYGYGDCGRGSASAGGTGQSRYSLGQEMTLPTITSLLCCIANQPEIERSLF